MRLVFAGTPEVALPSLEAIASSRHELVAVVTRPDAPAGRSGRPVPSPVARWAAERGLEILRPRRPSDPDFVWRLRELAPECCPVVAYGALIPAEVLAIPAKGWVNVHFSLLPAYRGAAPVQRAILAGDATTGISVFDLVPALDAGDVYVAEPTPLGEAESAGEVLERLARRGADLLVGVLDALESGTASARPQLEVGVTIAPKLSVAEAELDWSRPAVELDRLIRACNPSPVAWTTHGGERLRILAARVSSSTEPALGAGEFQAGRRSVLVGTGAGLLELRFVQPAGRRAMAAADWGRGLGGTTGLLGR